MLSAGAAHAQFGNSYSIAQRAGGPGSDAAYGTEGPISVGTFEGTLDYGPIRLDGQAGSQDAFVLYEYTPASQFQTDTLWARRFGGPTDEDAALDVSVRYDSRREAPVVVGHATGTSDAPVTFGGSDVTLDTGGQSRAVVVAFDDAGRVDWVTAASGGPSSARAIQSTYLRDEGEAHFVLGHFQYTFRLGNFSLYSPTPASFIARLDAEGAVVWARSVTSATRVNLNDLIVTQRYFWQEDRTEIRLAAAGTFVGDVLSGTATATGTALPSGVVLRLTESGRTEWIQTLSGDATTELSSIGVYQDFDYALGYVVGGGFEGRLDVGDQTLTSAGATDLVLATLSETGEWQQALRGGGSGSDLALDIADGNLLGIAFYASGFVGTDDGAVTIGDGDGAYSFSGGGGQDGFGLLVHVTEDGMRVVPEFALHLAGPGDDVLASISIGGFGPASADVIAAGFYQDSSAVSSLWEETSTLPEAQGSTDAVFVRAFPCALILCGDTEPDASMRAVELSVYPNPIVGRSLTARVEVATPQEARVEVFDLLGRRVALVYEGLLTAGAPHDFAMATQRLAPGTYVLRATTEDDTTSRTFTVLR